MSVAPLVESYLAPGPASTVEEVPAAIRGYLAEARAHLEHLHRSGASGAQVNETHSDLMDRLVRRLFEMAEELYYASGGEEQTALSVVAVGGYARREMNIHSDVDLLFLYAGRLTEHVAAVAERVQLWLWDAQLAVGAATRTIAETIKLARKDSTVRTGVLAPRFLIGSGFLYHEFQDKLREQLFSEPARFIDEQMEALEARHARFGDSLYLLQPNVKDGAGALRDYHMAYWVMQVSQPRARGPEDFLHLGLLTEAELSEYTAALDFLWRLRNELHLLTGRKNDQLSFEFQERIAPTFGYGGERPEQERIAPTSGYGGEGPEQERMAPTFGYGGEGPELPVERFMSDYYRHARAIQNYSSLVVEQCRQRLRRTVRRKVREVERGFRVANGHLEIPNARQLREDPVQLLEAYAVAQDHNVELTRKGQRMIREHLSLVDEDFRRSARAREAFERILCGENRVARTLMSMNAVGLLGTFIPEWEHVVCRWQHVMYHTYTVDVHSIFLVEELRRLWRGKYAEQHPDLTDLMQSSDDRVVLYLGSLLHDIGKGFGGGDHSSKGVERALPAVERLGLSPEHQERVIFLVRHHLLMSHLAQRRDLSDPKLISDFARTCGDRQNLRNLYLLTFADMRASSRQAWTDWKGRLLGELFERTAELLETGAPEEGRAFEIIERRVELRREAATEELRSTGTDPGRIEDFFEMMPRRYFTAHGPFQIARHARVVLSLGSGELMATARRELRSGVTEFIVCSPDRHGLFADIAGLLTANGINILGAHVYSTRTGLALEVYRVETPPGGPEERGIAWRQLERSLDQVLRGEAQVADLLAGRIRPLGGARPSGSPTTVSVSNEESEFYTIIDVATDDRLGLLHDLTRTIAEHGYEIYISKAAKIRDQVTDAFYLKDAHGKKLVDAEAIERLRLDLLAAARSGSEA